jgi:gliding motility-associated-like protein
VNTSLNALDCTWDLGIDNRAHVCSPPAYQLLEEGKYTVQLWVVSPEGCRDSVTRDFWFHTQPTIAYPNAFSPNGDGINDIFRIPSLNVTEFEVFIFDRWGNQIFFSDNPKFTWDGTVNGQPLPDGVYVMRIQGQGMHGEAFEYQGSITLIR